jgi:hypothetical protein
MKFDYLDLFEHLIFFHYLKIFYTILFFLFLNQHLLKLNHHKIKRKNYLMILIELICKNQNL